MPGIGRTAKKSIFPHGLKKIDVNKTAETAPDAPMDIKLGFLFSLIIS